MLSPLTSAHYEKFVTTVHQNVGLQAFWKSGTEKPRLGKILPPPKPEHSVLPNAGQHPKIRTSSFGGPRLAIGRRRRELHQRRSGLDCDGDQERVLNLKDVSLARNTE